MTTQDSTLLGPAHRYCSFEDVGMFCRIDTFILLVDSIVRYFTVMVLQWSACAYHCSTRTPLDLHQYEQVDEGLCGFNLLCPAFLGYWLKRLVCQSCNADHTSVLIATPISLMQRHASSSVSRIQLSDCYDLNLKSIIDIIWLKVLLLLTVSDL